MEVVVEVVEDDDVRVYQSGMVGRRRQLREVLS
jgi:hypothetical protein